MKKIILFLCCCLVSSTGFSLLRLPTLTVYHFSEECARCPNLVYDSENGTCKLEQPKGILFNPQDFTFK